MVSTKDVRPDPDDQRSPTVKTTAKPRPKPEEAPDRRSTPFDPDTGEYVSV